MIGTHTSTAASSLLVALFKANRLFQAANISQVVFDFEVMQ